MSEVKAKLRFYRQSPRKVRQVVDIIRGLSVPQAQAQLAVLPKRSAKAIAKLLDSAVANAKDQSEDKEADKDLFIKEIKVDQGPTYKRSMPRAQGRATMIRKRTSHISLVLGEKDTGKEKTEDKEIKKVESETKSVKRKVQNDSVKLKTKK